MSSVINQKVFSAVRALSLGRLVALQKPSGGVRGLVVGDFLRRLVARTIAQLFAPAFDSACHPYQYALSTRAGSEALVHSLQLATEADPTLTILSVDGIGAYDHVSRSAMLLALHNANAANQALPFARMFYSTPSTYTWVDQQGEAHAINQAEGGEQGDPLMPALFSLALHQALHHFHEDLQPGERVAAYLDDIYITAQPARIRALYDTLARHLEEHTGIHLHAGKTQIWNAAGVEPPHVQQLAATTPVWLGNPTLPPAQQGLRVLGLPLGHQEYVQAELSKISEKHKTFFDQLPTLPDLQTSWLLLLYCASPRVYYALRGLRPDLTRGFAATHDQAVRTCLTQLLQLPNPLEDGPARTAALALNQGGLGLRSALNHTAAAFWASWQDTAPILQRKAPQVFGLLSQQLHTGEPDLPTIQCLQHVTTFLSNLGLQAPRCTQCAQAPEHTAAEPADLIRGWQRIASTTTDQAIHSELIATMDPASQALLDSQSGPQAAKIFTVLPTNPEFIFEPCHFRVLLLRRLRLPLPFSPAMCRCRQPLDPFGDHRAACPRSGALRPRALGMERAAARMCREAGATVSTNVLVRDLNTHTAQHDERRIEVIANGLPLWNGSQLAVDTTLVSPLTAAGHPRRHQRQTAGAALRLARQAKSRTYPELTGSGRARLVVLGMETGGRWSAEAVTFVRLLAKHKASSNPPSLRHAAALAWTSRWTALLATAAMRSFACSLLMLPASTSSNVDGPPPPLGDVLTLHAESEALPSRLPMPSH